MGKGSPGRPKSAEHQAAIDQAMRAKTEIRVLARRKAAEGLFGVAAALSADADEETLRDAVVRLAQVVEDLVAAEEADIDVSSSKRAELEERLHSVTAELEERGGRLASMDAIDIAHAKRLGLISGKAADEELARRRETFTTRRGSGI